MHALLPSIIILVLAFLTLPTHQQTTIPYSQRFPPESQESVLQRVQDAITKLPECAKTCFSTVTGYTNPMTLQSLRVVCTDKTTSSSTASACAFRTCPTTDFGITRSMLSQLPIVCYKFSPAEFPIAGAVQNGGTRLPPGFSQPKSDAPEVSVNTMMVLAGNEDVSCHCTLAKKITMADDIAFSVPLSPTGLIHIEEIEPLLEHPSLSFIAPSDRQDFLRFLIQNHAQLALCYYKSRGTDEGVYKASNIPTPEEIKLAMDSSIERRAQSIHYSISKTPSHLLPSLLTTTRSDLKTLELTHATLLRAGKCLHSSFLHAKSTLLQADVEVSAATETLARASSEPSVEWAKKRVEKWKRMKKEAQEELESWEKEEKMFLAKLHRIAVRVSLMRRKVGMLEKRLMEG